MNTVAGVIAGRASTPHAVQLLVYSIEKVAVATAMGAIGKIIEVAKPFH
jgi:hypothetical protein